MRFVDDFVVTIEVPDPVGFETDRERNALLAVRSQYEGRCYLGKYLMEVQEVREISSCRLKPVGAPGEGVVNVRFTALCSRAGPGDVFPTAQVVHRKKLVVAQGENTGRPGREPAALTVVEPSDMISEGQLLPLVVETIQYPPMKSQPSAIAKLLVCRLPGEGKAWKISARWPGDERGERLLASLLEDLEAAFAEAARLNEESNTKASRGFCGSLLSTHRKGPAVPETLQCVGFGGGGRPFDSAAARDWARSLAPGEVWLRPYEKPYDWCGAARADAPGEAEKYQVDRVPAEAAVAALLTEAANAAWALNGLASKLQTRKAIDELTGLWRHLRARQLP